jgi:molecular chaperone DnaK
MPTPPPDLWTLAVDFGTSFTVAATAGPGPAEPVYFGARREPTMASGIFVEADGGLSTGAKAVNQRQLDPERYIDTPKRPLGEGVPVILLSSGPVSVPRMVSAVMGEAAAQASKQRNGTAPPRTVLTHPATWDLELQQTLVTAARDAGLTDVRVLAEPVAAALHLGRDQCQPGDHIAVYDLGGGTFDAAVLRRTAEGFEVEATGGQTSIGGEWFDRLLRDRLGSGPLGQIEAWRRLSGSPPDMKTDFDAYVAWLDQVDKLKDNVRFTKEVLSEEKSWGLIIPGYPEGWTVTVEMLNGVLREPLEQTVDVLASTIADAGLGAGQLAAIYLVGGASRTPLVRELLADRFPQKVVKRQGDPQTVVALGAAAGYDDATDPYQPRPPRLLQIRPRPETAVPREQVAESPLVAWKSRLGLAAGALGPATGYEVATYEAKAGHQFSITAVRKPDKEKAFRAFVAGVEKTQGQAGWHLTGAEPAIFGGASLGLTQRQSGVSEGRRATLTRVYAAASGLMVTAWARDWPAPAAAVDSLTIEFRTAGPNDQLTLAMMLPARVLPTMREDMHVRARWNKAGYPIWALTGPLPEGTATDEQVAQRLIAEVRQRSRFVVKVAARDVFLGSRPCVYHLLAFTATVGEHWWTGIVDGRFVRIAARGETRRQATKYREVITLR